MDEKLKAGLEERDIFWQEKMAEQERSHAEMVENKASALLLLLLGGVPVVTSAVYLC